MKITSYLRSSLFFILLSIWGAVTFSQNLIDKQEIQKIVAAMQIIDLAYVDSVDMKEIVADAIVKSLKELDPHSAYISKEELQKANEPLEGSFEGIGVSFQLFQDTILVISPVPGGPSEKLGILSGDKIVKINNEDATGDKVDNQWVMDRLRGKKGTTVDVSIYRKGKNNLLEFTIVRDKIPLNSIDASFMAAPDIGYIRLNRFSKTSIEEFTTAVNTLKSQGMSKLILDLRGNSGGYLNTAVELADEFLDAGKLIVYTEGIHSPRQDYLATPAGNFEKGKLVVIIDEASASASEIVSGAVQDWDRGIVIGRRSFGKGLVQRPFNLPDGSVIRLTTARYFTPTGRCIQRPYENGIEEYYKDFSKRFEHGEYLFADSIRFPDSLKFSTPRGRIVYGGGGIMPDVFIPWDSTMFSDYYVEIRRKGVLNKFSLQFVEENRANLNEQFPSLMSFKEKFSVDSVLIKEFKDLAEKEGVKFDEPGWKSSELLINTQIKAMVAMNLWNIGSFYEIMSPIDEEFLKAVDLLEGNDIFRKLNIG
ncbi:MAG: S41 family peptidase [Bacteroidales bacterium]|nr:S41 family peptidase [Bacteroidales bacterium]